MKQKTIICKNPCFQIVHIYHDFADEVFRMTSSSLAN